MRLSSVNGGRRSRPSLSRWLTPDLLHMKYNSVTQHNGKTTHKKDRKTLTGKCFIYALPEMSLQQEIESNYKKKKIYDCCLTEICYSYIWIINVYLFEYFLDN